MYIVETEIPEVKIIEPKIFADSRGYFFESFSQSLFEQKICRTTFVQDNESRSTFGVLRGLHFQLPPFSQSKLVRVVSGEVLDIAVDIRKGSPYFGKYVAVRLSCENKKQFFIPRGFAHGFVVLSDEAIFQYKCDNYYAPDYEGSIRWNDPELNIDWQVSVDSVILSEKDKNAPLLNDSKLFNYLESLY
ncbi:dTDP-4-dehydrorhamnose 3,5-epimerase [Tenuifilaceae bacterium CYCD]|nr:dTDP-4-dehydrorhamnose 3,5-epimerase [Tenuifilaceae bacterium CYCD]